MTLFFTHGPEMFWLGLDTRQSFSPVKAVFDAVVMSVRFEDGLGPGAGLAASLAPIAWEGHYCFVQPLEFIVALPAVIGVVLLGVLWFVGRLTGRLPSADAARSEPNVFQESHVEIGLARAMQHKFLTGAVTVDVRTLTVHTSGKPLLVVPRELAAGATVEPSWLGGSFVRLKLEGSSHFVRRRWMYGRPGPFALKIYSRDPERLLLALR